jgi:peptidyl-prolyl cis-trans isomerase SurA
MDLRRFPSFLNQTAYMTFLALLLFLAPTLTLAQAQPSKAVQTLDAIVVVINGQAISSLDLRRRERFLLEQLNRSKQTIPSQQELSEAVLERAIFETLMLQNASKLGLIPNDSAVQQAISDNAFQSGLTLTQFLARVEQSGILTADYTADFKNEMAMANVRERALAAKTKVTDADIDRFLREDSSGINQEYAIQVLFLPKIETENASQVTARRNLAQTILASAKLTKTDESFASLQKTMVDTTVKHEVNLVFKTLNKIPELFSSALETMGVGSVSPVLESSAGFYVLRLANKKTLLPQVNQTKARHILIRVDGSTAAAEETAKQLSKKIHDRLTLNIDLFPELAKEFGQDGTSSKGGDLGWSLPGDMVPEFERVMDVLNVGELALPLRTQFGWHLLQVLDRKVVDLPRERLRAQARNALRARKQDEALGEWLDQLKSQAYIEYKR